VCWPTDRNALKHNAHHTATHCSPLQHPATYRNSLQNSGNEWRFWTSNTLQHTATHCNILQHTATYCIMRVAIHTLQHIATHCNTSQHTATHHNTSQHTATHCNTRADTLHTTAMLAVIEYFCNTVQHTSGERDTLPVSIDRDTLPVGIDRDTLPVGPECLNNMIATHCNTMQHPATPCNTLQHNSGNPRHCRSAQNVWIWLYHTATHSNTLQHPATPHTTPQQTATHQWRSWTLPRCPECLNMISAGPHSACDNSYQHSVCIFFRISSQTTRHTHTKTDHAQTILFRCYERHFNHNMAGQKSPKSREEFGVWVWTFAGQVLFAGLFAGHFEGCTSQALALQKALQKEPRWFNATHTEIHISRIISLRVACNQWWNSEQNRNILLLQK